ncbi:restriction endonuclease, partial [Campylobacter coli]|nr:restriction endonuclease [Campylobacter coli]EIF4234324.1 restriction endonuclease [Campylobacter coli]EKF1350661.1 restriction endonuclease [Campylobacter coli]
INWDQYFCNLKTNLKENSKDYYFLIINKNDVQDIFIASLKSLEKISPNGNNLPFQAKWNENRHPVQREFKEAKDFIIKCFADSLKLRADAYFYFKRYFNEYF